MKVRVRRPLGPAFSSLVAAISCSLLLVAGCGSVHAGSGGGGSSSPTVTIAANPTTIAAGASSTLTVTATNATSVTVTGSDGSSQTTPAATGGTLTVKPAATTTYTATATGASGTTPATATATVTVTAAPPPNTNPTVTVTANPASIAAGSSSTLMIATTNTTTVTVAGSDGSNSTVQLDANGNGTQAVSPAATTTYTVTASGAAGTTPATATVTVAVTGAPPPPPVPTVGITANPTTINPGASSTLTVTETNATSLVIAGSDGSAPTVPVGGGTVSVSPKQTTTYSVTATNASGEATATATVTVNQGPAPSITSFTASPSSIAVGGSSTLTVVTANATTVTIATPGSADQTINIDKTNSGSLSVTPASTTTYTATANGTGGTSQPSTVTVTVVPAGSLQSIGHVIFMLQENHTFDDYFGMLNPYRKNNGFNMGTDGTEYDVDGIEDKVNGQSYTAVRGSTTISNKDKSGTSHPLYPLKSTCVDDMSSAWTESFGDVNLGNKLTTRPIVMNGYVSNADGFANSKCPGNDPNCPASFTDLTGDRAMGYYDQTFLNYYYYMASQFALSDRWFSPIESKSIPNRIATFTGGTTQGLVKDPSQDDHLGALTINNIFQELDNAGVSWKVYYTVTNAECDPEDCKPGSSLLPATTFSYLTYSFKYVGGKPSDPGGCTAPKQPDASNSFCIDPNHMASVNDPTNGYFADLKNGKLPSFAFIESGSGKNDEHPGYQQSVLVGQAYVASLINALMNSTSWDSSVFFLAYDEGGGPYDHVPPVAGHTNDFTDKAAAASYPTDVSGISVQPDNFYPCVPNTPDGSATVNCDLSPGQPGSNPGDAAGPPTNSPAGSGFGAQVGFRVPNMVVSPFVKKHYVSHVPMDHTAIIKFVEDRFIQNPTYLTKRDAAQPNLLDFFDFTGIPWLTPPTQTSTPPPTPTPVGSSCKPSAFH